MQSYPNENQKFCTRCGTVEIISKSFLASIECVKLLQIQAASKDLKGKEYKAIVDAFVKVPKEPGLLSFWRGNMTNVIKYFQTQAHNFSCKGTYKRVATNSG